jgi:hypothetical protein
LRRDEVVVDRLHCRNIQGNQPHGSCVKTFKPLATSVVLALVKINILGNTARNCLEPPSLSVAEFTCTEEDIRSKDPGPEHLPENRRPPLPATALSCLSFHIVAVYFSSGDTKGVVEFTGDEKHEDCEDRLHAWLVNSFAT